MKEYSRVDQEKVIGLITSTGIVSVGALAGWFIAERIAKDSMIGGIMGAVAGLGVIIVFKKQIKNQISKITSKEKLCREGMRQYVYEGYGTNPPRGKKLTAIAWAGCGKYYKLVEVQCVTAPCPPSNVEILVKEYDEIRESSLSK